MKNNYEDFNNVEMDLSKYENMCMTEKEILEYKQNFFKKKNSKKINSKLPIAALIVGVIAITLFTNYNQIYASIDKVSESIKSYLLREVNRDFSNTIENVNKDITDKNITVKLNEVLIDSNQIIINRTIDYSKLTEEDGEIFNYINEIKKSDNLGEIFVDGSQLKEGYSIQNIIDNNTYNWISVFTVDNVNTNPEILIKNEFTYTIPMKEEDKEFGITSKIDGNWDFNFKLDSYEITKNIKELDVNKDDHFELSNGDIITLTEITKSSLSIKINFEILTEEENEEYYANKLYVVNSKGERISNTFFSYRDKKGYIQYYIDDPDENNYTIKYYGSDKTIKLEL